MVYIRLWKGISGNIWERMSVYINTTNFLLGMCDVLLDDFFPAPFDI